MLKATIYDLALFENFLTIINKFVSKCQFVLNTEGVNVYCKNPTDFSSARLLLDSNVIKLDKNQNVESINICIRDVMAFKSSISIIQQIENVNQINIKLDQVTTGDDSFVKSIRYKGKNGGKFNLITIDFNVIKNFISKDSKTVLDQDWVFNVDPEKLDIAQNRTGGIVNLDEVSVYISPEKETIEEYEIGIDENGNRVKTGNKIYKTVMKKNGKAIVDLESKKSASINSISIPISSSSTGSLDKFKYDSIAIHESSFRIFNILKVKNSDDIKCFFNIANNVFFIESHLCMGDMNINSRLFIQMVKGK